MLPQNASLSSASASQPAWADLRFGNAVQRNAYATLLALGAGAALRRFEPTLVGSLPLGLDRLGFELELLCCIATTEESDRLLALLPNQARVHAVTRVLSGACAGMTARIAFEDFVVHLTTLCMPIIEQPAYRIFDLESRLLTQGGRKMRTAVQRLMRFGWRRDAAFATILGMDGKASHGLLALAEVSAAEFEIVLERALSRLDTPEAERSEPPVQRFARAYATRNRVRVRRRGG